MPRPAPLDSVGVGPSIATAFVCARCPMADVQTALFIGTAPALADGGPVSFFQSLSWILGLSLRRPDPSSVQPIGKITRMSHVTGTVRDPTQGEPGCPGCRCRALQCVRRHRSRDCSLAGHVMVAGKLPHDPGACRVPRQTCFI
jgi:hypothetical protein